jgi:hypothetical protein
VGRPFHCGDSALDRRYQGKNFMNKAINDFLFAVALAACLAVAGFYKILGVI